MVRLVCVIIIYVQSVFFCRYAAEIHRALTLAIRYRQQLLVDPITFLNSAACRPDKGAVACFTALQHKADGQWHGSCESEDVRHSHVARTWLLTTECRVSFLFYRPKILLFQQKILR